MEIKFNAEYFPDEGFRKYLKDTFLWKKGQELPLNERNKVKIINFKTNMYCIGTEICSLKGIEYFPKLQILDCDTQINLSGNLDLSHNPELTSIDVSRTKITGLDISGCSKLYQLIMTYCSTFKGTLDLSNKHNLVELLVWETTNLTELNVNNCKKLEYLDVSKTNIRSLDVNHNPELWYLDISKTNISSLDVNENPALTHLNISDTNICELDVSENPKLQRLDISGTNLHELDVTNNPKLWSISIMGTDITDIDLSQNLDLKYFNHKTFINNKEKKNGNKIE